MSIENDIISALNNHSGLSALVGSRNYAIHLPQNPVYPNTVFTRISTVPSNTLTKRNKLTNIRTQFDIRDQSYDDARRVLVQLKDAIENAMLFTALYNNENDVPLEFTTDTYRISVDFSIWFYDD